MTLEQTIEVPENRRVHFDIEVPREVPTGRTNVVIQFPVQNNTQQASDEFVSTEEALASARGIIEKYRPAFEALAK